MTDPLFDPQKTIFLIDGSSFLYRAYYSLRPLHTTTGIPVQAVYGFCRMLKKIIDTFDPKYLALVWDSKGKTVRHDIYPEYKSTRQEAPSDLSSQKELIQEFADLIGLTQIAQPGIEADDIMFSLAKKFHTKKEHVVFIGTDKDFGQVLSNYVHIYDPMKEKQINVQDFEEKFGFPPMQLPFYFALLGDASDNIPGVRGIGKKGATELVKQFKSLDDMYKHIDQIASAKTRNALLEQKDNAYLSKKLFLPHYIDLFIEKKNLQFNKKNWPHALPLFEKLQFKSLIKEIKKETSPEEKLEQIKKYGYALKTVTTIDELNELLKKITQKKLFALDTELNGMGALNAELIGLCIAYEKGSGYYVPFGHTSSTNQLSRVEVLETFAPILYDENIKKIMHHAKFDQLALAHYNIETRGLIFDTLIAAHLITEDWQRIGLKYLSEYYLKEPMLSFQDVVSANNFDNFAQVPLGLATQYAAMDAHQTLRLKKVLEQELDKQNMRTLYETIEFPLVQVLFVMEKEGIFLDTQVLKKIDKKVSKELDTIKDKIIALIGSRYKDINLNSPKQLAQLLFEDLKLPPQKKTSGKTGYSTDQEVLEELAYLHPVPALIITYRELFKLKTTYIDALPTYINPETGKIHTSFSQTAVATGRLSSSDPNLQNIPTDAGIREAFKPNTGEVFISADYSQIELRVLAFLSQDQHLIEAFLKDEDIHQKTAANIFDVPLDQVTSKQRQIGKRINFSIMYGLTPYGLSKDLRIPFADAKKYIEKYFAQYPGVLVWMDSIIDQTKEHGYVTTHWGRRRYVPGIYETNKTLYELAKRIAINTAAQGTAAELMKKGMLKLYELFHAGKIQAKLILQIHDELLISVPSHTAEQTSVIIKEQLETVVNWNVPLKVSARIGDNWQDVTK